VYPETGLYNFKSQGVSPFSGIYKIIKIESNFKDGLFIQNLKLARMQKQPSDFEGIGEQKPDNKSLAIIPSNKQETATTPPEKTE